MNIVTLGVHVVDVLVRPVEEIPAGQGGAHGCLVCARVEQGSEQHVARGSADAVDVQDHRAPPALR